MAQTKIGTIGWRDLTVDDASKARDFYPQVVGWSIQDVDMDGYTDFSMASPSDGEPMTGVCHARGVNADLPPQWLIYIHVADLQASLETYRALGGETIAGARGLAGGQFTVIRDPAGAVCALFQSPDDSEPTGRGIGALGWVQTTSCARTTL
jgi:predicted enzyme related to lactoylglutathione lyase